MKDRERSISNAFYEHEVPLVCMKYFASTSLELAIYRPQVLGFYQLNHCVPSTFLRGGEVLLFLKRGTYKGLIFSLPSTQRFFFQQYSFCRIISPKLWHDFLYKLDLSYTFSSLVVISLVALCTTRYGK